MNNLFISIGQRVMTCVRERRLPYFIGARKFFYTRRLQKELKDSLEVSLHTEGSRSKKNLFVSAVGSDGKAALVKILERFGHADFDYRILVYEEGVELNEKIFSRCEIIRAPGMKWPLVKKYVAPDSVRRYRYLFIWDDDVDIHHFSYERFLWVMERNGLEMAQPALTRDSHYSHRITLQHRNTIGRFVDYVENMVPVFTGEAWNRYWQMIQQDESRWGWAHTYFARAACAYRRMGIVDAEAVRHTRPIQSKDKGAREEFMQYFPRYRKKFMPAMFISYGSLKG